MEMHELEQAWGAVDARLSQQELILRRMETGRGMDSLRSRLRLVSTWQVVELLIGVAIVLWAGGYWWDHLDQPHVALYGIGIHLFGLALIITSARQLYRLTVIDYRQPVVAVQSQLLALRRMRAQGERVLLVVGFVAWVPFLFLVLRRFGMDVWLTRPDVVLWNLGAGVLMAVVAALLMRRYPGAFEKDATGRRLREIEAELADLADPT